VPGSIVAEVLRRLEKPRRSGSGWTARCPAHEDREPSLSVAEGSDGRALLTCHRGCKFEDIASALGMAVVDLFPPRPDMAYPTPRYSGNGTAAPKHDLPPQPVEDKRQWSVVATYDYVDATGTTVFQVQRKEPPIQLEGTKRRKTFVQRKPDGDGWAYSLEGIDVRPLYRLPELLEDLGHGRTILLVEGEKDADTARSLGVPATAHAGGAKGWRAEYATQLAGADVVIVPDNDDQGRAWAVEAAGDLVRVGARVRMFATPVTDEGADLTDWVQSGASVDQVERAIVRARPWTIGHGAPFPPLPSRFHVYSDTELETLPPLRFFVDGVFAEESLLCIYGPPGCGKSFLSLDLACCVSTGSKWLGKAVTLGSALYVAAEGGRGYRKRVLAWKHSRLLEGQSIPISFVLEPANLHGTEDVEHILRAADTLHTPPSLVVFDTLHRSMTGGDENSAQDIGMVMDRAGRLKRELGCSVLFIHHTRKDGDTERGSVSIRGSVDTHAEVRDSEEGGRELACVKQKDFDEFSPIKFDIRPVGDSCVIQAHDPNVPAKGLTPRQRDVLRTLASTFVKGATSAEWQTAANVPPRTFYLARASLVAAGFVSEHERGNSTRFSVTEMGRITLAASSP
jgi:hypothetical protein